MLGLYAANFTGELPQKSCIGRVLCDVGRPCFISVVTSEPVS